MEACAVAYAAEEGERRGHRHIGTEHVLLGLARARLSCGSGTPRGRPRTHCSPSADREAHVQCFRGGQSRGTRPAS
ncbi:MAG: hypothetical protein DMG57_27520 [Acidobacteria bacterium]|nr:MAG: hypothetical protein DMG57_27520 [Acidobacteriota bacterium]